MEVTLERPHERSKIGNFNTLRPRSNNGQGRRKTGLGYQDILHTSLFPSFLSHPIPSIQLFPDLSFRLYKCAICVHCWRYVFWKGGVLGSKTFSRKKSPKTIILREICAGGMTPTTRHAHPSKRHIANNAQIAYLFVLAEREVREKGKGMERM